MRSRVHVRLRSQVSCAQNVNVLSFRVSSVLPWLFASLFGSPFFFGTQVWRHVVYNTSLSLYPTFPLLCWSAVTCGPTWKAAPPSSGWKKKVTFIVAASLILRGVSSRRLSGCWVSLLVCLTCSVEHLFLSPLSLSRWHTLLSPSFLPPSPFSSFLLFCVFPPPPLPRFYLHSLALSPHHLEYLRPLDEHRGNKTKGQSPSNSNNKRIKGWFTTPFYALGSATPHLF